MSDLNDPMNLRAPSREQRLREEELRRMRQQRAEDVKRLMSFDWGRRLMCGLLGDAKTYHPTFNTNAMTMARDEGRRSFGLDLLTYIEMTCPEAYITMLQENIKRQKQDTK